MWLRLQLHKVIHTETGAGAAGGLQVLFCVSLLLLILISHFIMASAQLLLF